MISIIEKGYLLKMYKNGYFPMAKNKNDLNVNFYKPHKRFLIPIKEFHIPKKLFKEYKKKNLNLV
ncbi:MAG: hypothetical protein CFH19_00795 [Alphaproteobacteria bacterium MarineAlpha5_Bin9]|nr:MAG: hypothetical protein CFH19_00795 [Alphaproteobacteria bacterium MarineAlpha5_Bin9]|tara:strand:+ start:25909 stop:26103 length:195 start_codon:yes stop_codon:yes gene_type:complete